MSSAADGVPVAGYMFMALHALQFALQPMATTWAVGDQCIKFTLVLVCELMKVAISLFLLLLRGEWSEATTDWTISAALTGAGIPAVVYACQNVMIQISYQHLDSLSFNLVNQTKMFFTATFVYIFIGKRQSMVQCFCLVMLMAATAILGSKNSKAESAGAQEDKEFGSTFWLGFIPCLGASVCSGISSALSQRTLQVQKKSAGTSGGKGRNSLLFSLELSFCSSLVLIASLMVNQIRGGGGGTGTSVEGSLAAAFVGFEAKTFLPPLLNAAGGVVVGMVIKYAGGVRKGFATTVGILLTGLFDHLAGKQVGGEMLLALPLVVVSSVIYTRYPYKKPELWKGKKDK